jgi:heme exporter protein CcmD
MTMVLGTYAVYVWSAYVLSGSVLGAAVAVTYAKWYRAKKHLEHFTVSRKR